MRTGEFSRYDYGTSKNLIKYGLEQPPVYNVSRLLEFDTETYLYYGDRDYLVDQKDFNHLIQFLPKNTTSTILVKDYAHLDYVWGADAYEFLYKDMIEKIENAN